jgi:hypothetical protein
MVTCDIKLVTGHNQFLKVLLCVNPALLLGIVHQRHRKQLVMYVYEQCLCKKSSRLGLNPSQALWCMVSLENWIWMGMDCFKSLVLTANTMF